MAEWSDAFKQFRKDLEEHAEIERVIGRCIASIDETACRSREAISETRELLTLLDKQFGKAGHNGG